ncbi:glycosyltransferase family 2 protein [Paraclostridium bifermentans]|uniref:glycosyltransferase family 2 protein n=1 Tax=Paraclostridium bifermentans TaxID=1490 RepID=UPI00290FC149|nr:glycosyltransferase family 2 protein [Paraclostridium bifermentans]MDU3338237.1 glycosyltransferase family 2 protein [Paraclostridium bifermentans]
MVDVLMATYNGEDYIEEQIESILNQSYTKWKLYIRDDGSTDNTLQIIEKFSIKYPEKIFLVKDDKKGLGAKGNFKELMRYSSNDYCMFSDQDDIWLKDKIEKSFEKIKSLEELYGIDTPILVHTDLRVVDENKKIINNSFWKYQNLNPNNIQLRKLLVENIVTGCTMIINKPLLNLSKNIPKESVMHDSWIALVASAKGKVYSLDEQTILYRQHSKNEVGAKSVKGIGFIQKNLNQEKINLSINNSIGQASKLYEIFNEELTETDKQILKTFKNIRKHRYLKRKYIVIKYKFYKNDFKRRLGYLIFI